MSKKTFGLLVAAVVINVLLVVGVWKKTGKHVSELYRRLLLQMGSFERLNMSLYTNATLTVEMIVANGRIVNSSITGGPGLKCVAGNVLKSEGHLWDIENITHQVSIGQYEASTIYPIRLNAWNRELYFKFFNPWHWTIADDDHIANITEEWKGPRTQSAVKYDFSMHARYRLQVLQTEMKRLAKTTDCASVMANPVSFWRSQLSAATNFTADIDLQRFQQADKCTTIPIADFLTTPPLPALYSFEIPCLEDPPVTDMLKVSNESTSSVVLVNRSSSFFIGDTVALFITVRDGKGNPKSKGGDEIRAWFTDVSSSKSSLPAKITDYSNGTYLATAVLAFIGTFRAYVTMVYSREYIQTLLLTQLMIKSTTIYLAAFRNSQASETTVCFHVPVIPGVNQTQICNLTEINGTPWFCGRPVKPWLNCTDYVHTRKLPTLLSMPMNEAEKLLMTRESKMTKIPESSNITFNVSVQPDNKNLTRLTSTTNCSTIPPRLTWEQPEPTGYLYKGLWHSYFCRRPERVTTTCLRNMHIIILGDSNAKQLYQDISPISSCKETTSESVWHKPLKCINANLNFTVEWWPHSNPFRTGDTRWAGLDWIKASNKVIDEIPSTGRYLVHIHHFLHAACAHISSHVSMMTAVKESLTRLLKRNANVTLVIQGPHVLWELGSRINYLQGDALRKFYTAIHYEIFEDLRDHIYYLQTSDMTIAAQSSEAHPLLNWQISNMMTGFICGRQ